MELNTKLLIKCSTQEQYNKIVECIGWENGEKYEKFWKQHKRESGDDLVLEILDGYLYTYGSLSCYKREIKNGYRVMVAEEFLIIINLKK